MHFLAYRPLLRAWEEEEARCQSEGTEITRLASWQNTATIGFPGAFPKYVDRCWQKLCMERNDLVGTTNISSLQWLMGWVRRFVGWVQQFRGFVNTYQTLSSNDAPSNNPQTLLPSGSTTPSPAISPSVQRNPMTSSVSA